MNGIIQLKVQHLRSPKREHAFLRAMRMAYQEARKSPDSHTQNGAVVIEYASHDPWTFERRGIGHNPTPPHFDDSRYTQEAYKTETAHHAEVDAIIDCACRNGRSTFATMVCPWAACLPCARAIVRAKIVRVVRHRDLHIFSAEMRAKTGKPSYEESIAMADAYLKQNHIEIVELVGSLNTYQPIRHSGGVFKP